MQLKPVLWYLMWLPTGDEVQLVQWCTEVSFWFRFNWNRRITYVNDQSPCILESLGHHSEQTGSLCCRMQINDAKIFVRILSHDGTAVNNVNELKQRQPWKESEQGVISRSQLRISTISLTLDLSKSAYFQWYCI